MCGGDQPDLHLVFHCVPRAALLWFVPTAFDSGQASGFGCCKCYSLPPLAVALRPRLLPDGFAASQWYLLYTNPSGKASGASEGSSGHALPPFPSTDRAVPKLGAENSLHRITPWTAFSQFSASRVLARASLTGWVNPKASLAMSVCGERTETDPRSGTSDVYARRRANRPQSECRRRWYSLFCFDAFSPFVRTLPSWHLSCFIYRIAISY